MWCWKIRKLKLCMEDIGVILWFGGLRARDQLQSRNDDHHGLGQVHSPFEFYLIVLIALLYLWVTVKMVEDHCIAQTLFFCQVGTKQRETIGPFSKSETNTKYWTSDIIGIKRMSRILTGTYTRTHTHTHHRRIFFWSTCCMMWMLIWWLRW